MAYYIFLKSLRSLEEFRKNPHVKIPPKSSSTIFQSLAKFRNPIFIRKFVFLYFRPGRPCGPAIPHGPAGLPFPALACRPARAAWLSRPTGRSARARRWRILGNTLSSLNRAFRLLRLLSLLSLTCGPHMSDSSSSPRHREPAEIRRAAASPAPFAPCFGCRWQLPPSPFISPP
jgi:hypothetical protein